MSERAAKEEELRQRARALAEKGEDVTGWLEEQLTKIETDTGLTALEMELAARERIRTGQFSRRWLIGFVWVFVLVVIIVHALS
jgi:hypothetical protein